jgi:hypothetical protein
LTNCWFERNPNALDDLEKTLRSKYPTLHAFIENGECRVRGTYAVLANSDVAERYSLEIALPSNYPHSLPVVWETGGRIPRETDRHVFPDGSLCLGVPLALWVDLRGNFSIENILEILVRNFLIGNSLIEQGEPWPYGDRPHGVAGVLEHYGEFLGTSDPLTIATFLLAIVQEKVRGHWPCPCGSGKIIRKCHKAAVEGLSKLPKEVILGSGNIIIDGLKRQKTSINEEETSPLSPRPDPNAA